MPTPLQATVACRHAPMVCYIFRNGSFPCLGFKRGYAHVVPIRGDHAHASRQREGHAYISGRCLLPCAISKRGYVYGFYPRGQHAHVSSSGGDYSCTITSNSHLLLRAISKRGSRLRFP